LSPTIEFINIFNDTYSSRGFMEKLLKQIKVFIRMMGLNRFWIVFPWVVPGYLLVRWGHLLPIEYLFMFNLFLVINVLLFGALKINNDVTSIRAPKNHLAKKDKDFVGVEEVPINERVILGALLFVSSLALAYMIALELFFIEVTASILSLLATWVFKKFQFTDIVVGTLLVLLQMLAGILLAGGELESYTVTLVVAGLLVVGIRLLKIKYLSNSS
jgi:4-hydroxybenzoate polyprenyltransferase